jgi:hypothetical protein
MDSDRYVKFVCLMTFIFYFFDQRLAKGGGRIKDLPSGSNLTKRILQNGLQKEEEEFYF